MWVPRISEKSLYPKDHLLILNIIIYFSKYQINQRMWAKIYRNDPRMWMLLLSFNKTREIQDSIFVNEFAKITGLSVLGGRLNSLRLLAIHSSKCFEQNVAKYWWLGTRVNVNSIFETWSLVRKKDDYKWTIAKECPTFYTGDICLALWKHKG